MKKPTAQTIRHARHDNVPPLINDKSKVLVLGSMLSPKSCEAGFYYAHPQNRFWRVLAGLFDEQYALSNDERAKIALDHGIALWDVIAACDIAGAADNTINNVEYNDIVGLLNTHPNIVRIFTTGQKAHELLNKYNKQRQNPIIAAATRLPSTSPLNCATSLDALIAAYGVLKTE